MVEKVEIEKFNCFKKIKTLVCTQSKYSQKEWFPVKSIIVGIACILLLSVCYATPLFVRDAAGGTSLQFPSLEVEIELAPEKPLYARYAADNFSTESTFQLLYLQGESQRPSYLYNTVKLDGYTVGLHGYNFDAAYNQEDEGYFYARAGVAIPFFRFSFGGLGILPPFAMETVFEAGIRTVFFAFGGTDQLGFDGTYFYGVNLQVSDSIALKMGRKHYSAHVGDELITRTIWYNNAAGAPYSDPSLDPSSFQNFLIDYVRQDPLTFGISIIQFDIFRFYGELRIGEDSRILKPNLSNPDDPRFANYHAREVEFGLEMRLPIPLIGDLVLAVDATMHENGKFILVPVENSALYKNQYQQYDFVYDDSAPWELEYNLTASQTFSTRTTGPKLQVSATYHKGRFPLHAFFMHKISYVSLGLVISG